jgi:hypothetical protein
MSLNRTLRYLVVSYVSVPPVSLPDHMKKEKFAGSI